MSDETTEETTHEVPETIHDIEALPEAFRQFYHEKDGAYHLRDVTKLESAIKHAKTDRDKIREERDRLKTEMQRFDGLDVEEYQRLKEAATTPSEEPKKTPDVEAVKRDYEKRMSEKDKAHKEALKEQQFAVEELRKSMDVDRINAVLASELAKAGATDEGLEFLPLKLKNYLRVVDGGVVVVGPDGTPDYNGNGDQKSPAERIKEEKITSPGLFKGSGASGGGAPANGAGGASNARMKKASEMSVDEKSAFIRDHGKQAWFEHLGVQT